MRTLPRSLLPNGEKRWKKGLTTPTRAALLAACVASALGMWAGSILPLWAEEDKTASLLQYTPPPAGAGKAAAWSKAAIERFDAEDCTKVMSPEGICACCNTWWMDQIGRLFANGRPVDTLSGAGLTVHGFDGTLQGGGGPSVSLMNGAAYKDRGELPWLPCSSGWCENAKQWLSTSVINTNHRPGFSDGGMILKSSANKVLCSHYHEFESLHDGCATDINANDFNVDVEFIFPADKLKDMLERSATFPGTYNEVLVDSGVYASNLPHSVAAFYYGLLGSEESWPRVHATQMYVAFLDFYQLNESQVPLVQFELDGSSAGDQPMIDTSAQARDFLRKHPYSDALTKWQGEHAELVNDPERIHEGLRKDAEARRAGEPKAGEAAAKDSPVRTASPVEAPETYANGSYKLTRWSNPDVLNHLFKQGKPSNNFEEVGLMVHCFDDTEGLAEPWTPCKSGFCVKSSTWWSGSIINQNLRTGFGDSGLIMTPSKVELLCSYDQDAGTLFAGCTGKGEEYYGPGNTQGMMLEHVGRGGSGYNEVVIDSRKFVEGLPSSVSGVVFGLKSGRGGNTFDRTRAVHTYVMMLDRYNLSASDFPLLRANYDVMDFSKEALLGPAFVDESSKAREYLKKHPYSPALEKWNREHPYLRGHPDLTHEWMRKQNELEQAMLDQAEDVTRQEVKRRKKTKSPTLAPEATRQVRGGATDSERVDDASDSQRPAHKAKPLMKEWRPWNQQAEAADSKLADDGSDAKLPNTWEPRPHTWEWRNRDVPCTGKLCKDSESHSDH